MTASAPSFSRFCAPPACSWLRDGSPANSDSRLLAAPLRRSGGSAPVRIGYWRNRWRNASGSSLSA
jgi:hypothetical protein